jgi:O-antigen/teichoic acid export membrane protein
LLENNDKPPMIGKSSASEHKTKAIEAASFVILGFGLSQIIRLAGNIILTRILVPELFGEITIARVFVTGLYLFSDIGLEPAIIRSKRSNESSFLNTAWTIQIIRTVILALISCAIAYPVSVWYKQPILGAVIPVIGIFSMAGGFQSTSLNKLDRELQQKKLTMMELAIQIIGISFTIAAAFFFRNIWALLLGEFIGSIIRTIWSHAINGAQPNKWQLERESVRELLSFGKWILLSTAMMFLATQADRIILGKFFTMAWFGVYSIAVTLAELPKQIVSRLSAKVLFPLISKYSHYPREELRERIRVPRRKILFVLALLLALFACFGDVIIRILYDQRYKEAEWILPLLAIGMWPLLLISTIDSVLLSIGKPNFSAMGNFTKFVYMVIMMPLACIHWGQFGAIVVVALNDIPSYIIINFGLSKEKLSLRKQDLSSTCILIAAVGILLLVRVLIGLPFPGLGLS